ncbi:hypothetical protein ACXR0O_23190 [Verrucomicrobiota bacterium sgz303538]
MDLRYGDGAANAHADVSVPGSDHLWQVGALHRRSGRNKREIEYVINPGLVRKAEDGTAIFDFGRGRIYFPKVRLRD